MGETRVFFVGDLFFDSILNFGIRDKIVISFPPVFDRGSDHALRKSFFFSR